MNDDDDDDDDQTFLNGLRKVNLFQKTQKKKIVFPYLSLYIFNKTQSAPLTFRSFIKMSSSAQAEDLHNASQTSSKKVSVRFNEQRKQSNDPEMAPQTEAMSSSPTKKKVSISTTNGSSNNNNNNSGKIENTPPPPSSDQQQHENVSLVQTPKSALKKTSSDVSTTSRHQNHNQQQNITTNSLNNTFNSEDNASLMQTVIVDRGNNNDSLSNSNNTAEPSFTYEYGDLYAFEFLANARSSTSHHQHRGSGGNGNANDGSPSSIFSSGAENSNNNNNETVPWAWGVGRQILAVTRNIDGEEAEASRLKRLQQEEDNLDTTSKILLEDTRRRQKAVIEQGRKRVIKLELWEVEGREEALTKGERARISELKRQIANVSQELMAIEGQKKLIDDARRGAELAIAGLESALDLDFADVQDLLNNARRSLKKLKTEHFAEMRNYAKPPVTVKQVLECCLIALGDVVRDSVPWEQIKIAVRSEDFVLNIRDFEPSQLSQTAMKLLQNRIQKDENFTLERARTASFAAGPLFEWVLAQLECAKEARRSKAYFDLSKQIVVQRTKSRQLSNEANILTPKIFKLTSSIISFQSEVDKIIFGNDSISFAKNVVLNTDGKRQASSHTGLLLSSPFTGLTFVPQDNAPVVDMLKVACHRLGPADQLEPSPIVKLDGNKCQIIQAAFDLPKNTNKSNNNNNKNNKNSDQQQNGEAVKKAEGFKTGGKVVMNAQIATSTPRSNSSNTNGKPIKGDYNLVSPSSQQQQQPNSGKKLLPPVVLSPSSSSAATAVVADAVPPPTFLLELVLGVFEPCCCCCCCCCSIGAN